MKDLTTGDQNPQGLWVALHGVGSASESGVPLRSWRLCESNEVVKEYR